MAGNWSVHQGLRPGPACDSAPCPSAVALQKRYATWSAGVDRIPARNIYRVKPYLKPACNLSACRKIVAGLTRFRNECGYKQAREFNGGSIVERGSIALQPNPSEYVFLNTELQRNLFRDNKASIENNVYYLITPYL